MDVPDILDRIRLRTGQLHWQWPYLRHAWKRRSPRPEEEVHVLLCLADHFEPRWNDGSFEVARERTQRWIEEYPRQLGSFRDSDQRPPRHTFFFPAEEYAPEFLDGLTELCVAGYGEVEVHLHHDHDTPESLRRKLLDFRNLLAKRHGLLARHRRTGEVRYAFIHGNWALNNCRPDGRCCGVNHELTVLRETGCYADFTFPSAPDVTQPRKLNSIYYAFDAPGRVGGHESGCDVGTDPAPVNSLMLIQGPLLLDWSKRKWGLFPGIENGCVQGSQPLHIARLARWLQARIQVPQRPDWFFVKLYAHGTIERDHEALLGESAVRFHQDLRRLAEVNPHFHYHYVTARETYNLIRAAEAGWQGSVAAARDFELVPSSVLQPGEGQGNHQHDGITIAKSFREESTVALTENR